MIHNLLFPIIKKFKGLSISMALVSGFAISLFIGLFSAVENLQSGYDDFLLRHGGADITFSFDISDKSDLDIANVEGVLSFDTRLSVDAEMKRGDGRLLQTRLFTFNEEKDKISNPYFYEKEVAKEDVVDVYIPSGFARNNNIKLGDNISLGYFGCFFDASISGIIETPESLYARASGAIWSDNKDFGLLYLDETEIDLAVSKLASSIDERREKDLDFKHFVDDYVLTQYGVPIASFSSIASIASNYLRSSSNQLLVRLNKSVDASSAIDTIETQLEEKGVGVTEASLLKNTSYDNYMRSAISQLRTASLYLPILFYFIAVVVIALFMHQIVSSFTKQMGVLLSLGFKNKQVLQLFSVFILVIGLISGVIGILGGSILSCAISSVFVNVYSLPTIGKGLDLLISFIAVLAFLLVSEIAGLLPCLKVFKATPMDALSSYERTRKKNPKWLDKIIMGRSSTTALTIGSMAKSPRRLIVSSFSIFAAFSILLITSLFNVSKQALVEQSSRLRLGFDAQIYFSSRIDDHFYLDLKDQDFVKDIQRSSFAFVSANKGESSIDLEVVGLRKGDDKLTYIPSISSDKRMDFPDNGIILPLPQAKQLGVTIGDKIEINGIEVEVGGLSNQYFHYVSYIDARLLDEISDDWVSTVFINVNNENGLLDYLSSGVLPYLTVFSSALWEDLSYRYSAIDTLLIVLMVFSCALAFLILVIMALQALGEERRSIVIMRSMGFSFKEISNHFALQSGLHAFIGILVGVPCSIGIAAFLLQSMSSTSLMYPLLLEPFSFLFAFAFVILVVLLAHLSSILFLHQLNLADQTRGRE